jgi:hypothetical protein
LRARSQRPTEKKRVAEHCKSATTIHGLTSPPKGNATMLRIRGDFKPDRERPLCTTRR